MMGTELATLSGDRIATGGLELTRVAAPATPWIMRIEEHPSWASLARLDMTLRVGVALKDFRVRDLLAIETGQVFETLSPATEDVPVTIGQVQIGWS